MKSLTEMENNMYTTKLIDVILDDETDEENNHIFLVMDFCNLDIKQSLLSSESSNLNENHVITIVYNLLCAVNYMHSAGVVHRDLKPANLLLNTNC